MTGPEILMWVGVVIGTSIGSFTAVKKVPFWKSNGNLKHNGCPVTECHDLVVITAAQVKVLEDGQCKLFERVDGLPSEIVRLLRDTKGLLV